LAPSGHGLHGGFFALLLRACNCRCYVAPGHLERHQGRDRSLCAHIGSRRACRQSWPRFARHLEDGFRKIAARSREGLPPEHIGVGLRPLEK